MTDAPSPFNPSRVSWSGENPGIYLRAAKDGPFVALASFFRVVVSPHGPGRAVVVCARPDLAEGAAAGNFVIADNAKLARWLVAGFVAHFAAFRDQPALKRLTYLPLKSATTRGDAKKGWTEAVSGGGKKVEMTWTKLEQPVCVDAPPALSATGRHQMYSLFVNAGAAQIKLNGKKLPGKVFERPFFGRAGRTAFLAFSETWLDPD